MKNNNNVVCIRYVYNLAIPGPFFKKEEKTYSSLVINVHDKYCLRDHDLRIVMMEHLKNIFLSRGIFAVNGCLSFVFFEYDYNNFFKRLHEKSEYLSLGIDVNFKNIVKIYFCYFEGHNDSTLCVHSYVLSGCVSVLSFLNDMHPELTTESTLYAYTLENNIAVRIKDHSQNLRNLNTNCLLLSSESNISFSSGKIEMIVKKFLAFDNENSRE